MVTQIERDIGDDLANYPLRPFNVIESLFLSKLSHSDSNRIGNSDDLANYPLKAL